MPGHRENMVSRIQVVMSDAGIVVPEHLRVMAFRAVGDMLQMADRMAVIDETEMAGSAPAKSDDEACQDRNEKRHRGPISKQKDGGTIHD